MDSRKGAQTDQQTAGRGGPAAERSGEAADAATLRDAAGLRDAASLRDAAASAAGRTERAAIVTPVEAGEVEPEALEALLAAFQSFARRRRGASAAGERSPEVSLAVCVTLIAGPQELGRAPRPAPLGERSRAGLREDGEPEGRVCFLWLQCAAGEAAPDSAEQFALLAREELWSPVQALAWRALAHFGLRRTLSATLAEGGALSLVRADAWLDASHAADFEAGWRERVEAATEEALPALVREQWRELLTAEAELASRGPTAAVLATLASLASLAEGDAPSTYAAAQAQRIGTRAAAALARARLASRRDSEDVLPEGDASLLPQWEQDYLRALGRWQSGDEAGALALLEAALGANPRQTPARLALATLLAASAPEDALGALAHDEPTRELHAARATLLARLGRYTEARDALARCEGEEAAGGEPARFTFARGRAQARRQEQILRAVLAEQEGDWAGAEKFWRAAGVGVGRSSGQDARRLWAARRELDTAGPGQHWRRSQIKQTWERGLHELGRVPLVGDALFFRAAALAEADPERARRDLQTLLRQGAWVEAEQRAGGGRLIFVGDLLWRLGLPDEARRAYELAGGRASPPVAERLAVARVCVEVARGADAETIMRAAEDARQSSPASYWPRLLAAAGLLRAGAGDAARESLAAAEESGAPANVCRALCALCDAARGPAELSEEEISALALPEEVAAVLRYIFAAGTETARLEALARALGERWPELCPTDAEPAARRLLAALCEEDRWGEALECARALARTDAAWAAELSALVRVRHALTMALRGELDAADDELRELEAALEARLGPG